MFFVGFLTVVFHCLSIYCAENDSNLCKFFFSDEQVFVDIRTENFYKHCDQKTILALRDINHEMRQEVNRCLFRGYIFEKISDSKYQLPNKFLIFYFISSLYSLYGESYNWIEKPEKKELQPLASDENLYIAILAKKTELYDKFHDKFLKWLPLKKDVIDDFVEKKQIVTKLFNTVFSKNYSYETRARVLYITKDSEKRLKEKKIFHYFCVYHAVIKNVLKKENRINKDINYYYPWSENYWSLEERGACLFSHIMF